jgi:hypothetical protein
MSSYSCVLPVDWDLLWERVLPAWLSVLSGSVEPREFYTKYVPAGDEYGDLLEERYSAPVEYLSLFTECLHPPYLRVNLHNSGKCSAFLQFADSTACPYLLEVAIKQTAAVNLPGSDPYSDDYFACINHHSGRRLVAGTKNVYHFLESAFEVDWRPQNHHYAYSRRRQGASPELQELFESLFLYQRSLPGAWFPPQSPTWPGYDDLSFSGYLSPAEVKSLRDELAFWGKPSPAQDALFQLFTDRVRRAGDSGFGLLTIHAGL